MTTTTRQKLKTPTFQWQASVFGNFERSEATEGGGEEKANINFVNHNLFHLVKFLSQVDQGPEETGVQGAAGWALRP